MSYGASVRTELLGQAGSSESANVACPSPSIQAQEVLVSNGRALEQATAVARAAEQAHESLQSHLDHTRVKSEALKGRIRRVEDNNRLLLKVVIGLFVGVALLIVILLVRKFI